jgi:hypothetical protein
MQLASTRRAEERALSLLSLFRRQCPAVANAERIRGFNGLRGFPEKRSEHDPVRRSASHSLVNRNQKVRAAASGEKPFVRFGSCGASFFQAWQLWQSQPLFNCVNAGI